MWCGSRSAVRFLGETSIAWQKARRMVSFGSNSFTGIGQVDFWPFWMKNLKLIGWGGVSNTQSRSPEIMEELIDPCPSWQTQARGTACISICSGI